MKFSRICSRTLPASRGNLRLPSFSRIDRELNTRYEHDPSSTFAWALEMIGNRQLENWRFKDRWEEDLEIGGFEIRELIRWIWYIIPGKNKLGRADGEPSNSILFDRSSLSQYEDQRVSTILLFLLFRNIQITILNVALPRILKLKYFYINNLSSIFQMKNILIFTNNSRNSWQKLYSRDHDERFARGQCGLRVNPEIPRVYRGFGPRVSRLALSTGCRETTTSPTPGTANLRRAIKSRTSLTPSSPPPIKERKPRDTNVESKGYESIRGRAVERDGVSSDGAGLDRFCSSNLRFREEKIFIRICIYLILIFTFLKRDKNDS